MKKISFKKRAKTDKNTSIESNKVVKADKNTTVSSNNKVNSEKITTGHNGKAKSFVDINAGIKSAVLRVKKIKFDSNTLFNLIIALAGVLITVGLALFFTDTKSYWYQHLEHPSVMMPGILYPIIWGVLYLIVFIVLFILLQKKKMDFKKTVLFLTNGLLQIIWCFVFFTLHSTLGGVAVMILNVTAAGLLLYQIYKTNHKLGSVFLAYWLFMVFAAVINTATWILN